MSERITNPNCYLTGQYSTSNVEPTLTAKEDFAESLNCHIGTGAMSSSPQGPRVPVFRGPTLRHARFPVNPPERASVLGPALPKR